MNIATRGIRNAFRNWVRSGSIIVILALSIGLIIAMLAARQAVSDRIEQVKSSVGNTISISPAGMRGFEGGGEALTATELNKVKAVTNVTGVASQLSDRLTAGTDTTLESSIELGSLGTRRAEQNAESSGSSSSSSSSEDSASSNGMPGGMPGGFNPMQSITVTGLSDTSGATVWGGSSVTWKSGEEFDGTSTENIAVIGAAIAEKNSLKVGDTFTAYDTKIKIVGIYDAGNTFANNGVFMPIATLQKLSDQSGAITSMSATVNSVDNLSSVTTAIESALGDKADVTNSQETVDNAVKPLESVKTVALFSLIGALVAGAVVILMTMMMIVRERRREIGVMKAIGSSNYGIVGQFVIESVTLTVVAMVIGLGIGVVASTPLTNSLVSSSTSSASSSQQEGGPGGMSRNGGASSGRSRGMMGGGPGEFGRSSVKTVENITASVGGAAILYGVGAALLIAIIGSALPAFMISKIKPAEAMRSE